MSSAGSEKAEAYISSSGNENIQSSRFDPQSMVVSIATDEKEEVTPGRGDSIKAVYVPEQIPLNAEP